MAVEEVQNVGGASEEGQKVREVLEEIETKGEEFMQVAEEKQAEPVLELAQEEEAVADQKPEESMLKPDMAEEEAKLKAENEARLQAYQESRLKAVEATLTQKPEEFIIYTLKAEVETGAKVEEEARLKAENEARLKAYQESRLRTVDAMVAQKKGKQEESAGAPPAAGPAAPAPMVRVLPVQATLPQDLHFTVPPGCRPGQILCVQGPHGPLHVQAPPNCKPGQKQTVRLAAPFQHEVFVPAGAKPGDRVSFLGGNDEELTAVVPPGKRPGQVFHVSPPCVMLPVPLGAMPGDHLSFVAPNGKQLVAPLPKEVGPGQYFAVQY